MFWHACPATSFSSLRLTYRGFFCNCITFIEKNALPLFPSGAVFTRDYFILMCLSYSFHFMLIRALFRHFALQRFEKFLSKKCSAWHLEKMLNGHKFPETQFIPVDVPDWNSFHGIKKRRSGCSHIVIKIGRVSRKHSFKRLYKCWIQHRDQGRELRELVTV